MLQLDFVEKIHQQVLLEHGGLSGIRDEGRLLEAISRPFQSFGDTEFYPDAYAKAAAIGESIIMNHPFVDGNKRTGFVLMELFLNLDNKHFTAN